MSDNNYIPSDIASCVIVILNLNKQYYKQYVVQYAFRENMLQCKLQPKILILPMVINKYC